MQMQVLSPPPRLCAHVQALWCLQGTPQGLYSGLPKPAVELVISLSGTHQWRATRGDTPRTYSLGWLTPPQFAPRWAQTTGRLHLIGARLTLQTVVGLFGHGALIEQTVPISLEDLLGRHAGSLAARLADEKNDLRRMMILARWISDTLRAPSYLPLPSEMDLAQMGWRVDALAEHLGLSARGLHKHFVQSCGFGPKAWLQLHRFDDLVSRGLAGGDEAFADLAGDYGFSDQAHMNREFRRFSGLTPRAYLAHRQSRAAPERVPHFVPGSGPMPKDVQPESGITPRPGIS